MSGSGVGSSTGNGGARPGGDGGRTGTPTNSWASKGARHLFDDSSRRGSPSPTDRGTAEGGARVEPGSGGARPTGDAGSGMAVSRPTPAPRAGLGVTPSGGDTSTGRGSGFRGGPGAPGRAGGPTPPPPGPPRPIASAGMTGGGRGQGGYYTQPSMVAHIPGAMPQNTYVGTSAPPSSAPFAPHYPMMFSGPPRGYAGMHPGGGAGRGTGTGGPPPMYGSGGMRPHMGGGGGGGGSGGVPGASGSGGPSLLTATGPPGTSGAATGGVPSGTSTTTATATTAATGASAPAASAAAAKPRRVLRIRRKDGTVPEIFKGKDFVEGAGPSSPPKSSTTTATTTPAGEGAGVKKSATAARAAAAAEDVAQKLEMERKKRREAEEKKRADAAGIRGSATVPPTTTATPPTAKKSEGPEEEEEEEEGGAEGKEGEKKDVSESVTGKASTAVITMLEESGFGIRGSFRFGFGLDYKGEMKPVEGGRRPQKYTPEDLLWVRAQLPHVVKLEEEFHTNGEIALSPERAKELGMRPLKVVERSTWSAARSGGAAGGGGLRSGRRRPRTTASSSSSSPFGPPRAGAKAGGGGGDWRFEKPDNFRLLARAAEAWSAKKKSADKYESTMRQVKSICNKLSKDNFEKLKNQLLALEVDSLKMLKDIVAVIFDKALGDKFFQDVFSQLCAAIEPESVKWAEGFIERFEVTEEEHTAAKVDFEAELQAWRDAKAERDERRAAREAAKAAKAATEGAAAAAAAAEAAATEGGGEDGEVHDSEEEAEDAAEEEELGPEPEEPPEARGPGLYWSAAKNRLEVIGPFASAEAREKDINNKASFRKVLIRQCQQEFESESAIESIDKELERTKAEFEAKDAAGEPIPAEDRLDHRRKILELQQKRQTMKRRMLSNVSFIGQLFLANQLSTRIIRRCADKLLHGENHEAGAAGGGGGGGEPEAPMMRPDLMDDDDVEALLRLLMAVGPKFVADEKDVHARFGGDPRYAPVMDSYIAVLRTLCSAKNISSRVRFLCRDVIDAATLNDWKLPPNHVLTVSETVTVAEFRKAEEKRERERSKASAEAMRRLDRSGGGRRRGGGGPPRDFGGGGSRGASRHASGRQGRGNRDRGDDRRGGGGVGRRSGGKGGGGGSSLFMRRQVSAGAAQSSSPSSSSSPTARSSPRGGGGGGSSESPGRKGGALERPERTPMLHSESAPAAAGGGGGDGGASDEERAPVDLGELQKTAKGMLEDFATSSEEDLHETARELVKLSDEATAAKVTGAAIVDIAATTSSEAVREAAEKAILLLHEEKFVAVKDITAGIRSYAEGFAVAWEELPNLPIFIGRTLSPFVESGSLKLEEVVACTHPHLAACGAAPPFVAAAMAAAVKSGRVSASSLPLLEVAAYAGRFPSVFHLAATALPDESAVPALTVLPDLERASGRRGTQEESVENVGGIVDGIAADVRENAFFARAFATAIATGQFARNRRDHSKIVDGVTAFGPSLLKCCPGGVGGGLVAAACIQGVVAWWSVESEYLPPAQKTSLLQSVVNGLIGAGVATKADVERWCAGIPAGENIGVRVGDEEAAKAILRDL